MSYCIYSIIDPRSDQIFYVGHTSDFKRRSEQHLKARGSIPGLRIAEIKENGLIPLFVRLEGCKDKAAALRAEIFWIELLQTRGNGLTNAQGYSGYAERASVKRKGRSRLSRMKREKSAEERLEEIANGRPVRQGKSWSAAEDRRLRGMKAKSLPYEVMADALGRSVAAVKLRLRHLGKDRNV